jgi:hypothetical protein
VIFSFTTVALVGFTFIDLVPDVIFELPPEQLLFLTIWGIVFFTIIKILVHRYHEHHKPHNFKSHVTLRGKIKHFFNIILNRLAIASSMILISGTDAIIVFIIATPFYFFVTDELTIKLILVALFFLYHLVFLLFHEKRCLGMRLLKTHYGDDYQLKDYISYNFFYTISFSTLLFWINFPFDLLLINLFLIQLPTVLIMKTTMHGYLAGLVSTVTD